MTSGRAWQILRDLEAWQVTQIPRRPHRRDSAASSDQADLGAAQRMQALSSAFHYGAPVAFGWMREEAGGPVRVIAAGPALAGGADNGQDVLAFPVGARGQRLRPGQAAMLLGRTPCWMQLAGITDALLLDQGDAQRPGQEARPSLEDGLLSAWSGPFGWLVFAEPVAMGLLGELTGQVSLAQLNAQRSDSPSAQVAAQRLAARHAEFRQAPATGLWLVRVLAGGPAPRAAAQVAGLLCASADLNGLPYALVPLPGSAGLDEILLARSHAEAGAGQGEADAPSQPARGRRESDISAPASPFFASSRLVAALARPRPGSCPASGSFCVPISMSPRRPVPELPGPTGQPAATRRSQ
jgi:uncharacterized protein